MKNLMTKNFGILFMLFALSIVSCNPGGSGTKNNKGKTTANLQVTPTVDFTSSAVPAGPSANASKLELYTLAWQQFVALNWPVANTNMPGNRAKPNSSPDSTFLSVTSSNLPTVVWSTYASKAEVFSHQNDSLPKWSTLTKPQYVYTKQPVAKSSSDVFTLFNNLDENNEINEAYVFGGAGKGKTKDGNQVFYEAKMNEVEYSYLRKHYLQNQDTAKAWSGNTVENISAFGGTCKTDFAAADRSICFPCADSSSEGVIEIKAAWRALNSKDNPDHYFRQKVIVYNQVQEEIQYSNVEYGLVGLHIIRKTKNYPTFIFTTFNHVDNIETGIYYINELPDTSNTPYQYYKKLDNGNIVPDPTHNGADSLIKKGKIAVHSQEEIHAIPYQLQQFNRAIAEGIKSKDSNSVWQYYELLDVQAQPVDLADADSDSAYYLANDVIETDYTLRRFSGGLNAKGIVWNATNIITPDASYNMGGCQGCHGNAQIAGTDFSFLLPNGVISQPDVYGASDTNQ